MHAHELDQAAQALAQAVHSQLPQHQAGRGAARALQAPEHLASQIRPHLTPEVVEMLSGEPAAAPGAARKPFNLGNFIANLNKILPLVTTLVGVFTGTPIPPITIPTGGGQTAPEGA